MGRSVQQQTTASANLSEGMAGERPLRILDLINTDKSAKELLDHRVRVMSEVYGFHNHIYCGPGPYVERLRAAGHVVHVVEQPRGLSPLSMMAATWRTFSLLRREKYDVIHTHGSVIGLIGRLAAFLARTPLVVHQVHGWHHHDGMGTISKHVFIWVERVLGWFSDALLFQNMADIEECRRRRIAPERKLVHIGNGVRLESFPTTPPPENHPPVILCVSRFEPVKNHAMLIEAAHLLHQRGVVFRLLLAGDGDERPAAERLVRDYALDGCVTFLGYVDDIPQQTVQADICTLVSLKEGLPRALIEAASCGRPAVATDVVGNRDTVIDGKTGFLVALGNAAALADRLQQLIVDVDLRKTLGEQAAKHAAQHFNERTVIEGIANVYWRGLQKHRGILQASPTKA